MCRFSPYRTNLVGEHIDPSI
ncbi:MAG: hypothetical protein H0W49_14580 [Nitrospirales bacterium]|nr:hypothetical protein [Nitrospirales bacterium]